MACLFPESGVLQHYKPGQRDGWWLRMPPVLPEDPSWAPSTHVRQLTTVSDSSSMAGQSSASDLRRALRSHSYIHATHDRGHSWSISHHARYIDFPPKQFPLPSAGPLFHRTTAFCDLSGPLIVRTHTSSLLIFLADADGHRGLDEEVYPFTEARGHYAEAAYGKASVSEPVLRLASPFPQPLASQDPSRCLGFAVWLSPVTLTQSIQSPAHRPPAFLLMGCWYSAQPWTLFSEPLECCWVSTRLQSLYLVWASLFFSVPWFHYHRRKKQSEARHAENAVFQRQKPSQCSPLGLG